MKLEIKMLRILYVFIIAILILLFFYYTNNKESKITLMDYEYEILNIEETSKEVFYDIKINTEYPENILIKICNEIKDDYINLYKIKEVSDKIESFNIKFYYKDNLLKEFKN